MNITYCALFKGPFAYQIMYVGPRQYTVKSNTMYCPHHNTATKSHAPLGFLFKLNEWGISQHCS